MRVLSFTGHISSQSIDQLLADLQRPGAPQRVFVSSPGGQFELFSKVGPAIERRGLVTVAGDVRSAANILYLLGHRRLAYPDSVFFFHEVRAYAGPTGQVTVSELAEFMEVNEQMHGLERELYEEWLRLVEAAQSWYLRFMQDKTGLPASTYLRLMREEVTLSAREAMRYGIVHEIIAH